MAIIRDQDLGLLLVDTEPFPLYASLLRLELGDTLILGVRDEHQVVIVKKLPVYTSAELKRKRLQQQNEGQWAKGRTLMHTNSHAKLLTVLTIDPHTYPGIGIHAPDGTHSPLLDPEVPSGPP